MLMIVLVFVFSDNPEFETFYSLNHRHLLRISCVLGIVLGPRVTSREQKQTFELSWNF